MVQLVLGSYRLSFHMIVNVRSIIRSQYGCDKWRPGQTRGDEKPLSIARLNQVCCRPAQSHHTTLPTALKDFSITDWQTRTKARLIGSVAKFKRRAVLRRLR